MDDVWFGDDASDATLTACREALALHGGERAVPIAVWKAAAEPELVVANRAFGTFLGALSVEALAARLLHGQDAGAQRLLHLSQTLPLESAPHLERLRFSLPGGAETLTFLCRHVSVSNAPLFIAAVLGARPELLRSEAAVSPESAWAERPLEVNSNDAGRDRIGAAPSLGSIEAALRARFAGETNVRFVWQSDASLTCTQVTRPLADAVGANGDLLGYDLTDIAALIDPSDRFVERLKGKQTWSGLDVAWPLSTSPAAVTIGLGAIALRDRNGRFEGYRGYGIVRLDGLVDHPPLNLLSALPKPTAAETMRALPSSHVAEVFRARSQEDEVRETEETPHVPLQAASPVVTGTSTGRATDEVSRLGLAVLERLAVGVLVSRDNVPMFANRHLLDMFGFRDEDELHTAGGMAHLFGSRIIADADRATMELRYSDGSTSPASVRMQTIEWDGLPTTLLTVQDVVFKSTRQPAPGEASVSVAASEAAELQAILETATDGVAVIDADGNIASLNRSGEALFGCDRTTVIGKPFLSLFAPHNQDLAAAYLDGLRSDATQQLLNDGREFVVNAQPGATIPVFMTMGRLGPSPTPDGRSGARFCALFRDLTHWKKVETDLETARHEAERANALKSDFLAKVSHEIRTPLNAIIGFAEIMMEERFGAIGNDRYKEYLGDIRASGTHVMSLVNDLLDLSKIEAGKLELSADVVDANKVIGECVAIMQPQASRARVIMRLSLSQTLPQIKADTRSLRQIVLNLLSNAVKFNEPGGQVIVATAAQETGHVVIRIRDTGPGMSESDIAAAFEPFRQLATARAGTEGTGLGLPLTKALVEANQASLSIRSKVDQGTLVEVAFPPARVLAV